MCTNTLAALRLCNMKGEAEVWLYVAAFDDEQEDTLASGNELTIQKKTWIQDSVSKIQL